MRWGVLFALAACRFDHGALAGDAPIVDPDARQLDAQVTADVAIDARIAPYCDSQEPTLVACYQFEGNTLDSSANQLNASMTNVSFVAGKAGQAMQFDTTSAADVADSSKFDVGALTIEAWIWPSQLPASGQRAGVLDMNGQYGFFLHPNGDLKCTAGGLALQVVANIPTTGWTHVACTYDGTTATIYTNGVVVGAPSTGGGALSTSGTTGISLAADNPPGSGSRLIGLIDEVRFLAIARTAAEICADAGASCP